MKIEKLVRTIVWRGVELTGLLLLALLPRLIGLDQVATVDELAPWYPRTIRFLQALQQGDFAATYQSGHPGVTTMWLGSLALLAQRALIPFGFLTDTDSLRQLALLRTPVALVCALAVLVGYLLLRRLLPARVAFLAALLWATDPLLVAHSRVFHLDALLTSFATLSVLALLVYWRNSLQRWALLASGLFGGLALLTKQPSLVLLPLIVLFCLVGAWRSRLGVVGALRTATLATLSWSLAALVTVLLLWPALWVAPLGTLYNLAETARIEAGQGHNNGNFFLGEPNDRPGPLFYPAAVALRLTPWALVGLLLLPFVWRSIPVERHTERHDLALLAAFALAFLLFMTLSPKKFDRYALPALPALNILAAVGLTRLGLKSEDSRLKSEDSGLKIREEQRGKGLASEPLHKPEQSSIFNLQSLRVASGPMHIPKQSSIFNLQSLAVLAIAVPTLTWYHPNYLAFYNPLVGGGPVAQQVLPVGWGEGLDEARAWLNALPNSDHLTVAARSNAILGRRANFAISGIDDVPAGPADVPNYVLLYISNVQRQRLPEGAQWYADHAIPAHVVRLHGVEYVWIYQVPPPVPVVRPARFGPAVALRGYGLTPPHNTVPLRLALFWEADAAAPADYLLFAHLIGSDGRRYAQLDLPPAGEAPTSQWGAGRFYITALELPLPPDAPSGRYELVVGLYDPVSGQRVPPADAPLADPSHAGADAVLLATLEIQ